MFNSLTIQYLIQAPDYHLFTSGCLRNLFPQFKRHVKAVGCISGCASGISPVLKLARRVLVDETIIRPTLPDNSSTTKNIARYQRYL